MRDLNSPLLRAKQLCRRQHLSPKLVAASGNAPERRGL